MGEYNLLGQKVQLTDTKERFIQVQIMAWRASDAMKETFDAWYVSQDGIYSVINNFDEMADELIAEHLMNDLYNELAKYEIYDVSKANFLSACIDKDEINDRCYVISELYNGIIDNMEEEKLYREERKANRGQVIGGGFGLGGAIKGMATAAAINAATGMAHSVANSIGNSSSENSAKRTISELYSDSKQYLFDGLSSSLLTSMLTFVDFINERVPGTYDFEFDVDKSTAYLENAQNHKEKRLEFLIESFKHCPWSYRLYAYIFDTYPDERKNVLEISRRFDIDLSSKIDDLLSSLYTDEARENEKLAVEAKAEILSLMNEFGVEENDIIYEIEYDCLNRLCTGYVKASKEECRNLLAKINEYDASEKNKSSFIKKVTERLDRAEKEELDKLFAEYNATTEAECNALIETIRNYDVSDNNKTIYIAKVKEKIEAIWSKEDAVVFDEIVFKLNVFNTAEIVKAKEIINNQGRTKESKKYLEMLDNCSADNFKKARKYMIFCNNAFLKWIGAIVAALGILLFFIQDEFSFFTQALPVVLGVGIQIYVFSLGSIWNTLTINGKVINPAFNLSKAEFEAKCNAALDARIEDAIKQKHM